MRDSVLKQPLLPQESGGRKKGYPTSICQHQKMHLRGCLALKISFAPVLAEIHEKINSFMSYQSDRLNIRSVFLFSSKFMANNIKTRLFMPKFYYIARQTLRKPGFRIHSEECASLPLRANRRFLGTFYHEGDAVKVSRAIYPRASPCPYCFDNPIKYQVNI